VNATPKRLKPKDVHKKDKSFRVKTWGGPYHNWWIRVFPLLSDWQDDLILNGEVYELFLWPSDGDTLSACYLHNSLPKPQETQ
jgi:hypothetical protein